MLHELFIADVDKLILKKNADTDSLNLSFLLEDKRYLIFCSVYTADKLHTINDNIPESLDDAWGNVYVNNLFISDQANIPYDVVHKMFTTLKSLNLVYPNGRVHGLIKNMLVKKHNKLIDTAPKILDEKYKK